MAWQDYSTALLFQLAPWTTLQFQRLHVAILIVLSFLERALHLTLPPVTTAAIVHAFEEYWEGGGRGSADFVALVVPGDGCRWLPSAPSVVGGGRKCLGIVVQWRWRQGQ